MEIRQLSLLNAYLMSDGGMSPMMMTKEGWDKVNEIVQSWAEKKTVMFRGEGVNGELSGYLYMELGRIREVFGSAFEIKRNGKVCRSKFEYLDF